MTVRNDVGSSTKKSVVEMLKSKIPDSQPPHTLSLLNVNEIPHFDDIEITGAVIHKVVFAIQGGAGTGGTDAGQWHDVLLRYGSHSSRLVTLCLSVSYYAK
uniref:Uncharacterized protein n=1 Tax=Amphimedon queenslandica TaxID=400682 RepID=A0A1X7UXS3_AMPQE